MTADRLLNPGAMIRKPHGSFASLWSTPDRSTQSSMCILSQGLVIAITVRDNNTDMLLVLDNLTGRLGWVYERNIEVLCEAL